MRETQGLRESEFGSNLRTWFDNVKSDCDTRARILTNAGFVPSSPVAEPFSAPPLPFSFSSGVR
jgi:hypothetical protein